MSPTRTILRLLTSRVAGSAADTVDTPSSIDWRPAHAAVRDLFTWACDVMRAHAAEEDDREAIDRVQRYTASLLAGQRACCLPPDFVPSEVDLLICASTLIDALSLDLGAWAKAIGEMVANTYAALDMRDVPGALIQPRGSLRDLAWLLGHRHGPLTAYGRADTPANNNAPCARRAAVRK